MSRWLDRERFAEVIDATPLVSIDLIVRDAEGKVLLGYRRNKPAQNHWFVPGGRIRKNELLDDAFARLMETELGITYLRRNAAFLGVFQHLYDDNALDEPAVSTHYVVLAYEIELGPDTIQGGVSLEQQHSEQRWWEVEELLASEHVHANTKAYFDPRYVT